MGLEEVARYAVQGGDLPDFGEVQPEFIAKAAVFSRSLGARGPPAEMVAFLVTCDNSLFQSAFDLAVDDADMLVRVLRTIWSGTVGRRSLGSAPKAIVRAWLNRVPPRVLLTAAGVDEPNLAVIIRMVRPRPVDERRGQLFRRVIEERPLYQFEPGPVLVPGDQVPWVAAIMAVRFNNT